MNGTFSEQLGGVTGIFDQWGACERTVVACTLARRVGWPGLRLVQRAVEAALRNHVQDDLLEQEANDETLMASLLTAAPDEDDKEGSERLHRLLTLLPLLRTDNERAKDVYVAATPALVQRCIDAPRLTVTTELCRQLLTYLLVHPALTMHDQRTLTDWLRYLENHISGQRNTDSMWQQRVEPGLLLRDNIWGANNSFRRTIGKNVEFRTIIDSVENTSYTADPLQESFSKNGRDVDISLDGEKLKFDAAIAQPKQRSNSLTPPSSHSVHMSSSAENLSDEPFQKPRSFSLSSEHSLGQLRPLSGAHTTGSETRLDHLRTNNFSEHPGMATVGPWLKSLRLHKYVWLFTNISYEQMMAIDEKYLEKLGVTKGARHKLMLSIKKLKERGGVVAAARGELATGGGGGVARALQRLRPVLLAPMPPASTLPADIVDALHAASLRVCAGAGAGAGAAGNLAADGDSPDPTSLYCWLVEKALHHPSFSSAELQASLRRLRHRLPPLQFYHHVSDTPLHHRHHHRWRVPAHNGYKSAHKRSWAGAPWTPAASSAAAAAPPPQPRGKSHSYPPGAPRSAPPPLDYSAVDAPPPLDYSSLDALCLQMTEQAIN